MESNQPGHMNSLLHSLKIVESERDTLKQQVTELQMHQSTLMATCRSLAQELESRDEATRKEEAKQKTNSGPVVNNDHSHFYARCNDLEKALEEARVTSNQMQKLDIEKSKTIEKLSNQLQAMQLSKHSSNPAEHQEGLDRLVMGYKAKISAAEEKQANAEVELGRLRQHYQAFIDNLQRENENLIHDRDRIGALEAQLQVYAEDFKSERHDREVAQGRVVELEKEVGILRAQLDSFQESSMARLHRNRMAALANLQNEYQQRHRIQQSYDIAPYQLRARGMGPIECDSDEVGLPVGEDEDIIDSLSTARGARATVVTDGGDEGNSDSMLQCPKCNKGYTAEDHAQFLEHIDKCCDTS